MKLSGCYTFTKVLPIFKQLFDWRAIGQQWKDSLVGNYPRQVQTHELIRALIGAYLLRLPNLESMGLRFSHWIGTQSQSTLSEHFSNPKLLELARNLLDSLAGPLSGKAGHRLIEVIDGMPQTIPITQRGKAPKYNNVAKGSCVMWSFALNPQPGSFAIRLLGLFDGKINEGFRLRMLELRLGVLYLLDRGYYNCGTCQWMLDQSLQFIMRIKKSSLKFHRIVKLSGGRKLANGIKIIDDQIAQLGGKAAKTHPQLRLIRADLPNGEDLYLVTSELDMPAEEVLRTYRLRGLIEPFHRFLKSELGLAHLYSFDGTAMKTQAVVALLLAGLLYLAKQQEANGGAPLDSVLAQIEDQLKRLRRLLRVERPWKRNTFAAHRRTSKHARAKATLQPPNP